MKEKYRSYIVDGTTFAVQLATAYTTGIVFRLPYLLCINNLERVLVAGCASGVGSTLSRKAAAAVREWLDDNLDYLITFVPEDDPESKEEADEFDEIGEVIIS